MPNGLEPTVDHRCPSCGMPGLDGGAVCRACCEETECRELRHRLFGFAIAADMPLPPD